jgi:ketosteroid isomerase-like protein
MTMASTNSGKEGAVSAAVESLRKAMAESDQASLTKLTEDQLLYSHSSGRVENKAEFIATLVGQKSGFSAISLSDQTVNVVEDIALVRHKFVGTRKGDGNKMNLAVLTVWRERGGQWKLLARQAAKVE